MNKHTIMKLTLGFTLAAAVVLTALTVHAQVARHKLGMFAGSGTATNVVIIPPQNGQIAVESLNYSVTPVDSATVKWYPASRREYLATNLTTQATNVYVRCDSDGLIGGQAVAANDYLVVIGTNYALQLAKVAALGAVETNAVNSWTNRNVQTVKAETIGTVHYFATNPVFIVKSTDIASKTVTANGVNELLAAVGVYGMPLAYSSTQTGTVAVSVSGVYSVNQ